MRRSKLAAKLLLLTTLLIGFLGFIFVKYFFLDSQKAEGQIKILSSPKTSVFINNIATGKSTPYEQALKVGEYLVKIIPQEATATASWQGKVKIYKNSLTYINRELGSSDASSAGEIFTTTKMKKSPRGERGEIQVETEPTGALVDLDNDEKGVASLILSDVPAGIHELSVFLPGFLRRTQKINVDRGYRVSAIFKLAIDKSQRRVEMKNKEATDSAKGEPKVIIRIKETGLGLLRVRSQPSVSASESAQDKQGDDFEAIEEKGGWYKIEYSDGKEGWVSGEYAEKL